MHRDDLHDWLHRQPFQPFRLHLTGGQIFEVRHPELAILTRSTAILRVQVMTLPLPLAHRRVIVTLIHIVYVDFIEPTVPPSFN